MSKFEDDIQKYTNEFFSQYLADQREEAKAVEKGEPEMAHPIDAYQTMVDAQSELEKKRFTNGARVKLSLGAVTAMDELNSAYQNAKRNVAMLEARGDKMRATVRRNQYMNDNFLPAIEAVVRFGSADELLGAREVLEKFDEMTLLPGISGKGYTEAIIRSLYDGELGQTQAMSDDVVRTAITKIKNAIAADRIREGISEAKRLLSKIDAGENAANDDDYMLLQKIVERA